VRQKLDEGYRLVITGSNASLLSRELGTHLTGRHIGRELYPFSFAEYCLFVNKKPGKKLLDEYLLRGGFPEYLKTNSPDVLRTLQYDILYRDIAVRYNVRDISSLLTLYTYLVTNAAQLVSPNKLVKVVNAKSATTVREYISYFENSYLMQQVPRFDWSAKKQSLAPKKIYIVDNGIIANTSLSFTRNTGALLENLVFMALRRLTADIFYYGDAKGECDFVVNPHGEKTVCIQVCVEMTLDNREREAAGLCRALDFFGLKEGLIVTRYQQDLILEGDKRIEVLPAWEAMGTLKKML
jgi:predicted AAA+ superfamily ATPase